MDVVNSFTSFRGSMALQQFRCPCIAEVALDPWSKREILETFSW